MGKKVRIIVTCIVIIGVLVAYFGIFGLNTKISKTIPVYIHKDGKVCGEKTHVLVVGNQNRKFGSATFVGTFAIPGYDLSCRDGAEAKIRWYGNYADIQYYYAGDFLHPDVEKFELDKGMDFLFFSLKDGPTILTPPRK